MDDEGRCGKMTRGGGSRGATQRAKFAKKVHKPSLSVNVISFEVNEFNASIWVP